MPTTWVLVIWLVTHQHPAVLEMEDEATCIAAQADLTENRANIAFSYCIRKEKYSGQWG